MIGGVSVVDLVLLVALAAYAVQGYRQGLLVSALSLVGFLAGGVLGLWLLPVLLRAWQPTGEDLLHTVVLVGGVFLCAFLVQGVAVRLGARLRSAVHARPVRALDALLGSVAVVAAVSVLVWFVAGAVRGGASTALAGALGQSRMLRALDVVVPPQTSQLFEGFRQVLDREGFPRVFSGVGAEPIAPVSPPARGVLARQAVRAAAGSVVRVTGSASCNRGQEGSGWVAARERVVTNAHVVAGVSAPSVQVRGVGRRYAATVVVFDPRRDLAVLAVPGLPAKPLPRGASLGRGDSAVVAGFPLDGPYRSRAARVRDTLRARGSDIYGQAGTVRLVYSLYAQVQSGNSGGPLLSASGKVVGVVFARSLDDPRTGYALTLAEARPVLDQARRSQRVGSGACAAG